MIRGRLDEFSGHAPSHSTSPRKSGSGQGRTAERPPLASTNASSPRQPGTVLLLRSLHVREDFLTTFGHSLRSVRNHHSSLRPSKECAPPRPRNCRGYPPDNSASPTIAPKPLVSLLISEFGVICQPARQFGRSVS